MKVSFDFDGTLNTAPMQKLAKKFIALGADVYITTAREFKPKYHKNDDLYKLAEELRIPKQNIRFTGLAIKAPLLQNFDLHFDNDEVEVNAVNERVDCLGVLYDKYAMKELF